MSKQQTLVHSPERIIAQFLIAAERISPILRELADEVVDGHQTRRAAHAIRALDFLEKAVLMAEGPKADGVNIEHFTRSTLG